MVEVRHAILRDNGQASELVVTCVGSDGIRRAGAYYVNYTFKHASELWHVCQEHRITHVWAMAGSVPDVQNYNFFTPRAGYNIFVPMMDKNDNERPQFARGGRIWKEGTKGFQVYVGFPQREPYSWPVTGVVETLATVTYLEDVLDVPVQWSSQSIGIAKLQKQYASTNRLRGYLEPSSRDLRELPFRQADHDLLYVGNLNGIEGTIIHMFDKEAAHPSAASHMTTGVGTPEHIEGHADPKQPGIYHITWRSNGSKFDGATLPPLFDRPEQWTTQPMLKFALLKGYEVKVHEAWVFQQNHKLFDKWVAELWEARLRLRVAAHYQCEPARYTAEMFVKQIMNSTISAARPNWWADMVGVARLAMLLNIEKYAGLGFYPALIYHDAVAYVSSIADHSVAIPRFTERQGHLGGYKHKFSLFITPALAEELRAARASADGVMKILNREAARAREVVMS